jgi:hypothetical protein
MAGHGGKQQNIVRTAQAVVSALGYEGTALRLWNRCGIISKAPNGGLVIGISRVDQA